LKVQREHLHAFERKEGKKHSIVSQGERRSVPQLRNSQEEAAPPLSKKEKKNCMRGSMLGKELVEHDKPRRKRGGSAEGQLGTE